MYVSFDLQRKTKGFFWPKEVYRLEIEIIFTETEKALIPMNEVVRQIHLFDIFGTKVEEQVIEYPVTLYGWLHKQKQHFDFDEPFKASAAEAATMEALDVSFQ